MTRKLLGLGFVLGWALTIHGCGGTGAPLSGIITGTSTTTGPGTSGTTSTGTAASTSSGSTSGTSGTGSGTTSSTGSTSSTSSTSNTSTGASSGSSGGSTGTTLSCGTGGTTGNPIDCGDETDGGTCAVGATWQGDYCIVTDCFHAPDKIGCVLDAGGVGQCFGGDCLAPIDLQSDDNNCGVYGAICNAGSSCIGGRCTGGCGLTCPTGTDCVARFPGYSPDVCVASSCSGAATAGKACASVYGLGAHELGTCCGSNCLKTNQDLANCGGCGVACDAGEFCYSGKCHPAVDCSKAPPNTICGALDVNIASAAEKCCNGLCQNLYSGFGPKGGCGACGVTCPKSSSCVAGRCEDIEGGQGRCSRTSGCPDGSVCFSNRCYAGSCSSDNEGLRCGTDSGLGLCCGSSCVSSNSQNCGSCGNVCAEGTFCNGATCVPDLGCGVGGVGRSCALDGGLAGSCCGAIGCIDVTNTDPFNCGACGHVCPSEADGCFNGLCLHDGKVVYCSNGTCPDGTACYSGSVCLAVQCTGADEGVPCTLDGGYGSCSNGQCVLAPGPNICGAPVDCTGAVEGSACLFGPENPVGVCCGGSCVDMRQDGNCQFCRASCPSGTCGMGCQNTDGCAATCAAGTLCVRGQCVDGLCRYANDACMAESGAMGICCGDGACADLTSDARHCGTCDTSCPCGETCTAGVCSSGDPQCVGRAGGYCNADAGLSWVCRGGKCVDAG
jgi:hypothetical protein